MNHIETSLDLERHLTISQIKHYLHLQQAAIAVSDKNECRRTTDYIDRLTTEYGLVALHEAKEQQAKEKINVQ